MRLLAYAALALALALAAVGMGAEWVALKVSALWRGVVKRRVGTRERGGIDSRD